MAIPSTLETKKTSHIGPAEQRRVLLHDTPSLLLQAARGAMVVVFSPRGGVAAARIESVRFQVERRVLVGYHLIPRPRAVDEANIRKQDDDDNTNVLFCVTSINTLYVLHTLVLVVGFRSWFTNQLTSGSGCTIIQNVAPIFQSKLSQRYVCCSVSLRIAAMLILLSKYAALAIAGVRIKLECYPVQSESITLHQHPPPPENITTHIPYLNMAPPLRIIPMVRGEELRSVVLPLSNNIG